jgi:hypothetical protein
MAAEGTTKRAPAEADALCTVDAWPLSSSQASNVRFGSLADIEIMGQNVRFVTKSGHVQRRSSLSALCH